MISSGMMTSYQIVCLSPLLAAPLEPLAHCQNVASLSLCYNYYFNRCSSELNDLVLLARSRGSFTRYFNKLHDFSVTIPGCCKDVYVNSFFSRARRLWNSLHAECFPLTHDLNSIKYRVRHLFSLGSF